MLHRPPSRAELRRERQRRYRRRRRERKMAVVVEIDGTGIDWLITHPRTLIANEYDSASPQGARDLVGEAISLMIKTSSRA